MKTLILMRHGKSDWSDRAVDDHDRVLNRRGRLASGLMGAWLREMKAFPDQALVSSAARTQETWRCVSAALPDAPDATLMRRLYLADPTEILSVAKGADDKAQTLLILAHNPGLGEAAKLLPGVVTDPLATRALETFPTAATAILMFDTEHWADLAFGRGRLVAFATPKDLV